MMTTNQKSTQQRVFSPYQVFIIAILTIIQFSVILDFMVTHVKRNESDGHTHSLRCGECPLLAVGSIITLLRW